MENIDYILLCYENLPKHRTDKSKELDTRCGALSNKYGKCRVVLTNNTYRCSNTHLTNSRHRIASSLIL